MATYTLTLVDVRRVQRYLFNANELKQNLGASALIEQATHEMIIRNLPSPHNVEWDPDKFRVAFQDNQQIEKDGLTAEVIFMGGGNAAILFSSKPEAESFTRGFTREVLESAPNLDIAVGHVDVVWDDRGALETSWKDLRENIMPKRKAGLGTSQPLLGLGVTAECAFTGLPAVHEEMDGNRGTLMSAESAAKKENVDFAQERLNALLKVEPFKYPASFDDLGGERGRARYIAVVHADGNRMGNRITNYTDNPDNREMVSQMRLFSEALNQVGTEAIEAVCDWVRVAHQLDTNNNYFIKDRWRPDEVIRFAENYLPIRPIVFGGDDVTFVCDGRLGLALASKFLESFSTTALPDGKPGYACAGVAIVHSHYPFARAYSLAEALCKDAKHQGYQHYGSTDISLLNWHYASSGLTLDWEDITRREYQNGNLLLRPLVVNNEPDVSYSSWRTWKAFLDQIEFFRQDWKWGRNKLKDLREAMRKGSDDVRQFTSLYADLPVISGLEGQDAHRTGWYGDRCVYFDALETDDLFIYPSEVNHE